MPDFYGLPVQVLENQHLRLEFLAEAGPRIVRLFVAGSDDNLLAELPELKVSTPFGDYYFRGGHRLWHSPEAMPRTYVPDNGGLTLEQVAGGVRLIQPVEEPTGIRKSMEVRLHPDRPAVTIDHRLENCGLWPVELAPWALTMLPLGGVAILPQTAAPLDAPGLLPNRQLVLWPYTRWADARLELHDDLILLQAARLLPPCKVGYLNRRGWVAYLRHGVLFRKVFSVQPERVHPDFGCNAEFYCNDMFIEMETVAPLTRLEPGQAVTHSETWEFTTGVDEPPTIAGVRQLVQRLGL